MRRRLIQLGLFLLLIVAGAIVNVAVAWAGFRAIDGRGYQRSVLYKHQEPIGARSTDLWKRHASDGWPDPPRWHQAWQTVFASGWSLDSGVSGGSFLIPSDATDAQLRGIYNGVGSFLVEQIDCGFPFGVLRLERWKGRPMSRLFAASTGHDGWTIGEHVLPRRILPLRFAINTVFYAAILWLLFAAPFALRRWRRVKRGLCPACAYPIGDSAVCTECGKPYTVKPKEMAA